MLNWLAGLVDSFFKWIIRKQVAIDDFESKIKNNKKLIKWVWGISFFLSVVLLGLQIKYAIFIIWGLIFSAIFFSAIGWRKSVRKWLFISFVINFYVSTLVILVFQRINPSVQIGLAIYIVFGLLWVLLSLLGLSKVTKLVNEIVSAVSTVIFTIGTYLLSLNMPDKSEMVKTLTQYESNVGNISEAALQKLSNQAIQFGLFQIFQSVFIVLLPVIGISTICVALISTKQYWMNKNSIIEPGGEVEKNNFEWINYQLSVIPEWKREFRNFNENIVEFQTRKREIFELSLCDEDYRMPKLSNNPKQLTCISKTIEEIDRLSDESKVKYYGNLVNSCCFISPQKVNSFDEFFEILKLLSMKSINSVKYLIENEIIYFDENLRRGNCYYAIEDNQVVAELRCYGLAYFNDDNITGILSDKGKEFFKTIFESEYVR